MGVSGKASQFIKSRICYYKSRENPYQYYKSRENPYQYYKSSENPYQVHVLQVTCAASEHAMGSYDKIIITILPSYTGKTSLVIAVGIFTRAVHL